MIDKTEIVYISGPMTGKENFNRPAFLTMENILRQNFKCKVLNPANITDKHVDRYHRGLKGPALYRTYIEHDINLIFQATSILILNGYQNSKGALAEISLATCLNLVKYHEEDIRAKLNILEDAS